MKILVIELCNFEDYPTGGQLSFVRNMMMAYGSDLALAGITTDDSPVGRWFTKVIDGVSYDYYSVMRLTKDARRPLIPRRVTGLLALRRHIKGILATRYDWVFIQAPEAMFCLPKSALGRVAIDMPGLNNPLESSRYGWAKAFASLYNSLYMKRVSKLGHIWATGSEAEVDKLVSSSKGLLTRKMLTILPTRYDEKVFFPADRGEARNSIGIDEGATLLVTVGRLNRHKGWQLMIDALKRLNNDNARLALIGDGEDEMVIRQYCEENGLEGKVLLVGRKNASEIAQWLNAADLFVMGSEKEGWSTTLVEACACGVPCVVTDFSSARDMIKDGTNGYVVPNRDPQAFAEAIRSALALDRDTVKEFDRQYEALAVGNLRKEMDKVFEGNGKA